MVNYGYSLVDLGQYDQALGISKDIRETNPESAFTYTLQIQVFDAKHEQGRAVRALRLAYDMSPNFGLRFNLGFSLYSIGLIDEAVSVVENTEQDIFP